MFGPDGCIAVVNAEAENLMSVKSPEALLGRSIHGLLMRGVAGGQLALEGRWYIEVQN